MKFWKRRKREPVQTYTRVVGWGPFPLPGERKRREKAHVEAQRLMRIAAGLDEERRP